MVSAGGLTPSKVSIYVNASRCKLDAKRFGDLLKFIVTQHILPYRDPVTQAQKKKLRILKFDVSSNLLDDAAIAKLVGFVRQHAAYLSIKSMKLYQNKIGDEGCEALAQLIARDDGPTFQELHLSHNRITTQGAVSLVNALAACPRYPFAKDQDNRPTPLWLRLEHNFISAKAVLESLEKSNTTVCHVNAKGTACSPAVCQTQHAKLHLVFLHFQYWNESLESAKQAMALIRAERAKTLQSAEKKDNSAAVGDQSNLEEASSSTTISKNGDSKNPEKFAQILKNSENPENGQQILVKSNSKLSDTSDGVIAQATLPKNDVTRPVSSVAGSSAQVKQNDIQAGPLYLFMDTNAVITAVLEPKHPWSFLNLKKRFGLGAESAEAVPGSKRVVLVVTDTVLGELDGMHKKKVVKASVVNALLMEAEKQGWLMMLGAHQGEKLVQALDSGALLGLDVTTSNDRMIVDIALMFAEELGDPHCAMFISEDHGARLTARNRGLCTVSMSQLQVVLAKRIKDTWSSDNLKLWFLQAAPTKDMGASEAPSPGNTSSAQSPASRSNPIAQLRSLKTTALKAMDIAATLCVPEAQTDQLAELNSLLQIMTQTLQNIAVLPNQALSASSKVAAPSAAPEAVNLFSAEMSVLSTSNDLETSDVATITDTLVEKVIAAQTSDSEEMSDSNKEKAD
jgi:hypothetical protein